MAGTHLRGKVALVSGAGRSWAPRLRGSRRLRAPTSHSRTCSRPARRRSSEEVRRLGVQAEVFQADVEQVTTMVDAVAERFCRIDLLINSAGTLIGDTTGTIAQADRDRIWAAVHVLGLVHH
ncbi:SDR family NAD(P)-dependent oxidoreductase [Amycolatopsis sp. NPDC023774]|uniref:SDR family NAD(P)-dependent oxidoreductase n=1 Tax=Amycolatopsis sp. NPDC023774 TaxID=3155015 RepID=UPI0033F5176A